MKVEKYQFKERKYKIKDPSHVDEYVAELDLIDNYQVLRVFMIDKNNCLEVQRVFFDCEGKESPLVIAYGTKYYNYEYHPDYSTKFTYRAIRRIAYYVGRIIITKVHPELSCYFPKRKCQKATKTDLFFYLSYIIPKRKDSNYETIAKIDFDTFILLYLQSANDWQFKEYVVEYQRVWQLLEKYKYKNHKKKIGLYVDYLKMLKKCGYDLRNRKYICPRNIKIAHDKLQKVSGKLEVKQQAKIYNCKLKKYKELEIKKGDIYIKALSSVSDYKQEGLEQHNCVYSSEYFTHADTIIFTSYVSGKKDSTIEYIISKNKVFQCYGKSNRITANQKKLIKIVEKEMPEKMKMLRA